MIPEEGKNCQDIIVGYRVKMSFFCPALNSIHLSGVQYYVLKEVYSQLLDKGCYERGIRLTFL